MKVATNIYFQLKCKLLFLSFFRRSCFMLETFSLNMVLTSKPSSSESSSHCSAMWYVTPVRYICNNSFVWQQSLKSFSWTCNKQEQSCLCCCWVSLTPKRLHIQLLRQETHNIHIWEADWLIYVFNKSLL